MSDIDDKYATRVKRENPPGRVVSRSRSGSRPRSRSPVSRSPSRSRSRSRSRSYSRSPSRSRSRSGDRKRRYTRSRSRSRSPRHGSRRRRRSRRDFHSHSRSPMSNRRRHVGSRENPDSNSSLGIFGLSLNTTEKDLREVYGRYGTISHAKVVYDQQSGRSRGFAFLSYESEEDAREAKDRTNGMEIDGRRIRVDYSITKRAHTPTPGIYMGRPTYPKRAGYDRDQAYESRGDRNSYRDRGGDRGGDNRGDRGDHRGGDRYNSRRSPSPYYNNRRSPSPYYKRRYSRSRSRSYSRSPRRY